MENLLARLERFIDIEYDSQRDETQELYKKPLEERVGRGLAIGNLSAAFVTMGTAGDRLPFYQVRVKCQDNISKFREGTPVLLRGHGQSFECEVLQDGNTEILLEKGFGDMYVPRHLVQSDGWTLDSKNVDIRHIVKKSLLHLQFNPQKLQHLQGIFSGQVLPEFDPVLEEKARQMLPSLRLNDSQKQAFVKGFSAKNYYLVQGPPGTGKTWLLAYLAQALAEQGLNVLITAFTHTAINNALQKIAAATGYSQIVKVGKPGQKEGLNYGGVKIRSTENIQSLGYSSSSKGVIVGATCYSIYTKKLEWMPFDVVIIDEAAQLSIPLAVGAMAKTRKYILIGDHMQLPPIISVRQEDKDLACSVFELLHRHAPGTMLDTTYRMNLEINHFSSKQFYGGRLKCDESCAHRSLSQSVVRFPERHPEVLNPAEPDVLVCHSYPNATTRSEYEAELAGEYVSELINMGVSPSEIAVITPYRAQVRQVKKNLESLLSPEQMESIFVDTVERIQGQERDVVIISMTTSDPNLALEKAEFFFKPNRLNVALTRPRLKRIVIASNRLFDIRSEDPEIQESLATFQSFKQEAFCVVEPMVGEELF